jgi:heat shock protein HslJ
MSYLKKKNAWYAAALFLVAGLLAACSGEDATATSAPVGQPGPTDTPAPEVPTPTEPPAAEEKTLYVGPVLVDCVGVGPMKCMLVTENPDADYTYFYDQIEGFDYEEGYEYELLVKTEPVENPPADASSIKWTLIQEVSKRMSLEGRRWTLESYANNGGEPVSLLPGTEITIEFREGQVSGNAGCNGYFGSYEVGDNNLSISDVAMTEMFCAEPEGVMDQESAYLAVLRTAAAYQIMEDQLQITDVDGATVLTYSSLVVEPTPLTGTRWQLNGYNNGTGGFASVLADTEITAVFGDDGNLAGSAGCNTYNTSYEVDGNAISIGLAATTMMECPEPEGIMQQESAYLAALGSAATFEIQGDVLEIRDAEGTQLVSYVAAPPASLEGSSWNVIAYNNGKEAVVSVIIGTEITAAFGTDGKVAGSAGCNNYTASYEVDGENVSIGPAASTRMMCGEPEGIMEQEAQYLAALESAATFQIQNDKMEMRTADGALAVTFQAAETSAAPPELMAALGNMTYKIDTTQSGEATLVDGEYREQAAPGSATETVVQLTDNVALGTLDGEPAAAVILVSDPGGSGTFYYLALVTMQEGQPVNIATTLLGDRVQINSVSLADNQIVVDMIKAGPNDPLCCPTQHVVETFELQGDQLVQTSNEIVGSAESGGADAGDVIGIVWKWEQLTTPVDVTTVEDPEKYLVEFRPEGDVAVVADCNNGAGTYTIDGSNITIEIKALTMAACPPGSLSDEFVKNLNAAAIYFIEGDNLFIDLKLDSGTMKFGQ